jgi:hypothetical protein
MKALMTTLALTIGLFVTSTADAAVVRVGVGPVRVAVGARVAPRPVIRRAVTPAPVIRPVVTPAPVIRPVLAPAPAVRRAAVRAAIREHRHEVWDAIQDAL